MSDEGAADEVPLGAGWVEYVDDNTGVPYYFNEAQNQTTWVREEATDAGTAAGVNAAPKDGPPLAEGWQAFYDEDRKLHYYVHSASGKTTWLRTDAEQPAATAPTTTPTATTTAAVASEAAAPVQTTPTANTTPATATDSGSGNGTAAAAAAAAAAEKEEGTAGTSTAATTAPLSSTRLQAVRTSDGLGKRNSVGAMRYEAIMDVSLANRDDLAMQKYAEENLHLKKKAFGVRETVEKDIPQKLIWSKEPLTASLHKFEQERQKKNAVNLSKNIYFYCGDRASKKDINLTDAAMAVVSIPFLDPVMRDECFMQLHKQINGNPRPEAAKRAWELVALCCMHFRPTMALEQYWRRFVTMHAIEGAADTATRRLAIYALEKLYAMSRAHRVDADRMASRTEIERLESMVVSPLGHTLEELMLLQQIERPNDTLPRIVTFLVESIREFGGHKQEGIFRIPAGGEALAAARKRIEKGVYDIGCKDANVPAALLKVFFRELGEPLIPPNMSEKCASAAHNRELSVALLDKLPDINFRVLEYVVKNLFGYVVAHHATTRMKTANIALVFAPTMFRIDEGAGGATGLLLKGDKHQAFLRHVIDAMLEGHQLQDA